MVRDISPEFKGAKKAINSIIQSLKNLITESTPEVAVILIKLKENIMDGGLSELFPILRKMQVVAARYVEDRKR